MSATKNKERIGEVKYARARMDVGVESFCGRGYYEYLGMCQILAAVGIQAPRYRFVGKRHPARKGAD